MQCRGGKIRCLSWDSHKTHKYSVWAEVKILNTKPGGTYTNQQASTRYRRFKLLSLYGVGDR